MYQDLLDPPSPPGSPAAQYCQAGPGVLARLASLALPYPLVLLGLPVGQVSLVVLVLQYLLELPGLLVDLVNPEAPAGQLGLLGRLTLDAQLG